VKIISKEKAQKVAKNPSLTTLAQLGSNPNQIKFELHTTSRDRRVGSEK